MLGHAEFGDQTKYQLQTLIDNVSLLTGAALREINKVVVECGHVRLNVEAEAPLECRVDSAVTKTNVHWPTDVNLLRDAMDGEEGFVRTVALGVVAANVHRLGQIVKKQRRQYDRWHKARRKAA